MTDKLIASYNHLINERAQRLMDYNEAYPDVGMGLSWRAAEYEATEQLKREGLIPKNHVKDTK